MADWKPLTVRRSPGFEAMAESVRMMASGKIRLGARLVDQLGQPRYVGVARNGNPCVIGLSGVERQRGLHTLKLSHVSGGTRTMNGDGILGAIGKTYPDHVTELPYSWDGDVLVLDLSGLPDDIRGVR